MADITMPQLGETVTEGTITKWFKQVGDEVKEDEPLFEVSTDKVDSEVPSPSSGYLAEILVQEGDTVDVGTKLAVLSSDAPSGDGASGKVLSPVVRRLIAEHDLDPAQIKGSGAGGRITRADVLAVIDEGPTAPKAKGEEKGEEKGEGKQEAPKQEAPKGEEQER